MPASEPLSLRRKRTIFFTAKSPEVANAAHSIFQCCAAREGGGASGLVHIDTHGKDPVARLEAVKRAFHGFEPMGMVQRIVPPPRRAGLGIGERGIPPGDAAALAGQLGIPTSPTPVAAGWRKSCVRSSGANERFSVDPSGF